MTLPTVRKQERSAPAYRSVAALRRQGPGVVHSGSAVLRAPPGRHPSHGFAIAGTGPNRRVTKRDVHAALERRPEPVTAPPAPAASAPVPTATPAAASGTTSTPHSRLRKLIAARLQESKQTAPHFYVTRHLEVDALLELRAQANQSGSVRLTVNDFIVKAAALALAEVPEVNVTWTDEAMIQFASSDVAVAIASERGLVTPVVRSADTLGMGALSATIKDFAQRANQGRLQQAELEGGTFTVSNLGMFEVDEFLAILNPPHAGILAVGAAKKRPVVTAAGELAVATLRTFTVSFDHRAVDGAVGGRWAVHAGIRRTHHEPVAAPPLRQQRVG